MGQAAGLLALVGGGEWQAGTGYDAELLERSGADEVLVLPTAAAYEQPDRVVATAREVVLLARLPSPWVVVLRHADANKEVNAAAVAQARFIYLSGGSPLHLLSVLKGSLGLRGACERLAPRRGRRRIVGGGDGARRSHGSTRWRGVHRWDSASSEQLAVVPHHDSGASHHFWRTLELAPAGIRSPVSPSTRR